MKVPEGWGVRDSDLTEITVQNDLHAAKEPEDRIIGELPRHGYDPDCVFAIKLALEEAITNAVKHGNRSDPTKRLTVRYRVQPDRIVIMVRDEGPGFSPSRLPDCRADENLERPSGRGILLMQAYMTRVAFNRRGNEVWMLKERPANSQRAGNQRTRRA